MLSNIKNSGIILNKKAQQKISGGARPRCNTDRDCFLATGDRTDRCIDNWCVFY
ncbi:hypothetical protein [Tenacibaculum sp. IB213877]|uniref:hypothetical protein n=1 Tax=Tenacibaculum sp. IB213877 TaxID=3097351 RepID=UPI002A5A1940|nr:hypothetical protein [Tenacibaculum sp. IB213877]MDY0779562.1 hypothetical protein [Tenacibaculum sp. IB213877]